MNITKAIVQLRERLIMDINRRGCRRSWWGLCWTESGMRSSC